MKAVQFYRASVRLLRLSMQVLAACEPGQKVTKKGYMDYVTEADLRIQGILYHGFKQVWPDLHIVAEEDQSVLSELDAAKFKELRLTEPLPGALEDGPIRDWAVEDLCLWVDPIDGTLDLLKNRLQCVSVLVGLAVKGVPEVAIIGVPYQKGEKGLQFVGKVILVIRGEQGFIQVKEEAVRVMPKTELSDRLVQGVSSNRTHKREHVLAKELGSELVLTGGFGHKTVLVLQGEMDFFMYQKGTCLWDSCCAEVVAEVVGGRVTDLKGRQFSYDSQAESKQSDGVIVARSKALHKKAVQLLGGRGEQ